MFRSMKLNSVPTPLSIPTLSKSYPHKSSKIFVFKHIRAENYTTALRCWNEQTKNLCSTKTVTIFEISSVVILITPSHILKEWIH